MEIRYPILLVLGIILLPVLLFFLGKKTKKYEYGKKVANTSFLEKNEYYQKKLKQYKRLLLLLKATFIVSMIASLILIARPASVKVLHPEEFNRDILLCLDVSGSVSELDYELVGNFKETVKGLKGERIGVSLFDSSSVTLLPLTDDYDYVLEVLDVLQKSFDTDAEYSDLDEQLYYAIYALIGTGEGNGSSLIGDGLGSCVFNFSDLETERTRIILLATDNSLAGDPLLSLEEAAAISKKYNVIVYGIATDTASDRDKKEFQSAVELTGGKLYDSKRSTTKDIVEDINKTSKSLYKGKTQTVKTDIPTLPFTILCTSVILLILIRRKVVA